MAFTPRNAEKEEMLTTVPNQDRGDKLPLGQPQLMMSVTEEGQCPEPGFEDLIGERDQRYGVSHEQKAEKRAYIENPETHEGEFAGEFVKVIVADAKLQMQIACGKLPRMMTKAKLRRRKRSRCSSSRMCLFPHHHGLAVEADVHSCTHLE